MFGLSGRRDFAKQFKDGTDDAQQTRWAGEKIIVQYTPVN